MRTTCDECDGEGVIECFECGNLRDCTACRGDGSIFCCISKACIDPNTYGFLLEENMAALLALQCDARKAIRDAAELSTLRPQCTAVYACQLERALFEINRQANEILDTDKAHRTI